MILNRSGDFKELRKHKINLTKIDKGHINVYFNKNDFEFSNSDKILCFHKTTLHLFFIYLQGVNNSNKRIRSDSLSSFQYKHLHNPVKNGKEIKRNDV